jgi:hypothetical protein
LTHPSVDAASALTSGGFAFLDAPAARAWLEAAGSLADWDQLAASWEGMALDTYMADGGRYRRRRYGVFHTEAGNIVREPHQAHFQTTDYNRLNGGVERWFEATPEAIADSAAFRTVLAACRGLFSKLGPGREWHIETHQFRIEARDQEKGQPTPEGSHRDGVDFVLVLMVRRENIRSGVTSIHAPDGTNLGEFTLTRPFEAAIVNDHLVFHGVTAVVPIDPSRPAFRDVLVVTFRAQ